MTHDESIKDHIGPGVYVATFAALMVLLLATVGAAHFPLGPWSVVVALSIAVIKVALIGVYFMHLRYAHSLVVLFSTAGLLWLGILFTYTLSDYYTRQRVEPAVVRNALAEPGLSLRTAPPERQAQNAKR